MILPAVFREVYRQLEESDLVMDAYGDEEVDDLGSREVGEKKPLKLRTRITTSILSSILTMSYVVSGGIRVLGKCVDIDMVVYLYKCLDDCYNLACTTTVILLTHFFKSDAIHMCRQIHSNLHQHNIGRIIIGSCG